MIAPGDLAHWHRIGGMMNMPPHLVDRETPASLLAAFDGFRTFHGKREADVVSDDEFLEILAAEQAAGRASR